MNLERSVTSAPLLAALVIFAAAPAAWASPVDGAVDARDARADADGGIGEADGGADGGAASTDATPTEVSAAPVEPPAPVVAPPPPAPLPPHRLEELTVVGTAESRTAGSAHVLKARDLKRMNYDNPETVVRAVPGVYARGEDGFGLRPNIGIRGTAPDRSKKITLMEDGILFGPAPYSAPAAYFFPIVTRMETVRVIKGPGAVVFGPQTIGGAIDFVTRAIPYEEGGGLDVAAGQYGYGKLHGFYGASTPRSGYVLEGIALRSSGFKQLDGGGDTGFERSEWMWKGRYRLSNDPDALQEVRLKLGYAEEDSRETYLGLADKDLRVTPLRRYRASMLDRMQWHRTQIVASYRAELRRAFTVEVSAYRNDFSRTWRKFNRLGGADVRKVLADPNGLLDANNAVFYEVLTGAGNSTGAVDTIYIGPNRRLFVSQGLQAVGTWRGATGPVAHRLEAGVRFHYDRVDRLHTEDGFLMQDGNLVSDGRATKVNVDERAWAKALAVHVVDAATVGPLTVTPGFRVELISSWLHDRLAGSQVEGSPQRVFIPGLGVYGALGAGVGLFAGVYRGFSPAAPAQPATIRPESSTNYEAGVRWTPRRFRLEALGFFNDYRNLTSICTFSEGCMGSQVDTQYDAGRAHISGVELFARGDAPLQGGWILPVTASYTFTKTRLMESFTSGDPTLGDVVAGDELPFVPRHLVSATAGVEGPRFGIALATTYVSAMREQAGQGPTPTEPRTDPSWIADVTARAFVSSHGSIYLNVRNLFDAHDITARLPFGARPVAPRWVQVGTAWNF